MRAAIATQAGSPDSANEDWAGVLAPGLAVVLDGLSAPDCLALADAVLLLDTADGLQVVSDERVNQLAGKEREAANRVPAGSALAPCS